MSLREYYATQDFQHLSLGEKLTGVPRELAKEEVFPETLDRDDAQSSLRGTNYAGPGYTYSQYFRYFVRKSELTGPTQLRLFTLTYLNSYRVVAPRAGALAAQLGQKTREHLLDMTYSYPPMAISNFVVCPIPKRIMGEYAMTSRFSGFFVNPTRHFSEALLKGLNSVDFAPGLQTQVHTLAQAGWYLFSLGKDFFQQYQAWGWKQRQSTQYDYRHMTSNEPRVPSLFDEFFLPTLLETELFDVEKWPNYPKHFASGPEKYFFVMLTPYRNWTLFMANYPISNTFGTKGELQASNMALDWLMWLIGGVVQLLTIQGNWEEPSNDQLNEDHRYWKMVGKVNPNMHPFATKAGNAVNLSVIPFGDALTYIERGEINEPPPIVATVKEAGVETLDNLILTSDPILFSTAATILGQLKDRAVRQATSNDLVNASVQRGRKRQAGLFYVWVAEDEKGSEMRRLLAMFHESKTGPGLELDRLLSASSEDRGRFAVVAPKNEIEETKAAIIRAIQQV
jgi:hypothetical protein